MSIKILIADDQRLFRQSLRYLLEQDDEITVVAEAADGQVACTIAKEVHPDIVLMDVDMPKLDGISATRMLLENDPSIKILMLSVHDDDERIVSAMQNGASGYILKDADHREFIRIIKGTHREEKIISPFLANRFPRISSSMKNGYTLDRENMKEGTMSNLTDREREILSYLAEGKSNKELADMMGVSIETVKSHLQTIYKKLNVRSRTEAVIYYLKEVGSQGSTTIPI